MSKNQSDNLVYWNLFKQSGFFGKIALALSTCFGVGLVPVAPGTIGTLFAAPLIFASSSADALKKALIMLVFIFVAIWASNKCEDLRGEKDPPEIVIDEAAGFFLTLVFLPFSWLSFCCGFLTFRFFDILKPFPIKILERKLKGGIGIVTDDLAAGVYSYFCTFVILYIFK